MKRVSLNLFTCLAIALICVALFGCSSPGYQKNEEISKSRRDDMHKLNNQAVELFKKGDTKALTNLLSKELIDAPNTDARVRNIGHTMVVDSFALFDEYYVNNKYVGKDTIKSNLKTAGAYSLYYPAVAREMYFIMLTPADKKVPNQQMVTLAYAKYSYGWKICFMDWKPYAYNAKNGQELYQAAKAQYAAGQLKDAANSAALALECLRPNETFVYDNEAEIHSFSAKVTAEADKAYKLPITLRELPGNPYIVSISNKITRQGNFPLVTYVTQIKIKDSAAIEKENLQLRKAISKLMPGIDKNNQFIYYLVYNEEPSADNYMKRYDIRQDCW